MNQLKNSMKLEKFKTKLTKTEKEEFESMVNTNNTAISLISKGRCFIELYRDNQTVKLSGEKIDLDIFKECLMEDGKNIEKFFIHFGWSYEKGADDDSLSGEGVLAYILFQIMMGSMPEREFVNEFFSKLKLSV